MTHEEAFLPGAGGRSIYWQCWTPETDARAVVFVVHGLGEHSSRYAHVARRFVAEGHAVYALDHRGHGRSDGPRALIDSLDRAVADLDALVMIAAARHPGAPRFVLGHSMGGTVSIRYAVAHQDRLAGLVLTGPLAALAAASAPVRLAGRVLGALAPRLGLIGVDATLISRDPAVVAAYQRDPLVHHGRLPARTVAELAAAVESFPSAVSAVTVPTLILYGSADGLCPPAGSEMLAARIGGADTTLIAYDGLFHEILNEPEREVVLDEICGWLTARGASAGRAAAGSSTS